MRVTYVVTAEIPDGSPAAAKWELDDRLSEAAGPGAAVVDVTGTEAQDFSYRLRGHLASKADRAAGR